MAGSRVQPTPAATMRRIVSRPGGADVRAPIPVRRGFEAADREGLIAKTVALAEQEQMLPAQVGLAGGGLRSGQPVAGRKGQEEGLVEQRQGVQLSVLDGQGQQRGVDPVGPEPFEEMPGRLLVDHEPKVGIGAFERRQQPRQQIGTEGRDDAEIERPGQRSRPASRQRDDRIRFREHPPGPGDDLLARRRDVEPPVRTLEERHPQRLLEFPELRAQGRLADVAGFRRAAEMAEIGEGDEIAELPEGHVIESSNDGTSRLFVFNQSTFRDTRELSRPVSGDSRRVPGHHLTVGLHGNSGGPSV